MSWNELLAILECLTTINALSRTSCEAALNTVLHLMHGIQEGHTSFVGPLVLGQRVVGAVDLRTGPQSGVIVLELDPVLDRKQLAEALHDHGLLQSLDFPTCGGNFSGKIHSVVLEINARSVSFEIHDVEDGPLLSRIAIGFS